MAKISKDTKAPEGGEIVFDDKGEPAGVVKETAQGLIGRCDSATVARNGDGKALMLALVEAKKFGLTSVQGGEDAGSMAIYANLLRDKQIDRARCGLAEFRKTGR